MKPTIRVCVFYANGTKDDDGELNYHKIETIPSGLKKTQEVVGGHIEIVPGSDLSEKNCLVAFCNENGVAERLRTNDLAQICLKELGFSVGRLFYDPPLLGNILLAHSEEKSLTDEQVVLINEVVIKARAKWDGESPTKKKSNRSLTGGEKSQTKTDPKDQKITVGTIGVDINEEESTDSGTDNKKMDVDDDDESEYDGNQEDIKDEFDEDFFDEENLDDEDDVSKTVEYDGGEDDT